MRVCQFSNGGFFDLRVLSRDTHKCRYHKKDQHYSQQQMVPRGLCIEAFHSIYPFALGLLYGANKNRFQVMCPKGEVIFDVRREPVDSIKKLKFHLKSLIDPFYPVDPRKHKVLIKVVECKGICLKKHEGGQEFEFNQEKRTELCPAAFDSIFPYIYAYETSKKIPDYCSLSCQDHLTNVVFALKDGSKSKTNPLFCIDKDVNLTIKSVEGKCPFELKEGQKFKFSDIMPREMCASLFHNIYPYIFTLEQGGSFRFDKKKSMVVQCPNPKGRLAVNVMRKDNKNYIKFVQIKGVCPKLTKDIVLPNILSRQFPFCPKLFDASFPYVNALSITKNKIRVSCPNCTNKVVVELSS